EEVEGHYSGTARQAPHQNPERALTRQPWSGSVPERGLLPGTRNSPGTVHLLRRSHQPRAIAGRLADRPNRYSTPIARLNAAVTRSIAPTSRGGVGSGSASPRTAFHP